MSRQGILFDYSSPAELYLSKRRGRHTDYRRFTTAAEAIGYAVEELRTHRSLSVMDIVVWLRSLGLGKYEAAIRPKRALRSTLDTPAFPADDTRHPRL